MIPLIFFRANDSTENLFFLKTYSGNLEKLGWAGQENQGKIREFRHFLKKSDKITFLNNLTRDRN